MVEYTVKEIEEQIAAFEPFEVELSFKLQTRFNGRYDEMFDFVG